MVAIDQPPGRRSCHDGDGNPGPGGDWIIARDKRGAQYYVTSLEAFMARLPTPVVKASAKRAISNALKRASQGRCLFGPSPNDVDSLVSTTDVLELRLLETWPMFDGEKVLLRLFFSEPVALPQTLVALDWFWKVPADPDAKREQSQAAKDASALLHQFEMRNFD